MESSLRGAMSRLTAKSSTTFSQATAPTSSPKFGQNAENLVTGKTVLLEKGNEIFFGFRCGLVVGYCCGGLVVGLVFFGFVFCHSISRLFGSFAISIARLMGVGDCSSRT
jgi:hypothetical protein